MSGNGCWEDQKLLREHPELLAAVEQVNQQPEEPSAPDPAEQLAAILKDVFKYITRFVWLIEAQAVVIAVWVVHTYTMAAADATFYLSILSPEKRSGKSRLLEVLDTVVAKPWLTGRVTAACLVRKIDAQHPTLLLDEVDAAFASGEEYAEALRGVLNNGHRRGLKTSCCVGQGANITFHDFDCFSPKAIAGLSQLPETVSDRSVPIKMRRKSKDAKVERFRRRKVKAEADKLRSRIAAWAKLHIKDLREREPEIPDQLSDRQADGAEPLLAIAEAAGWEERLRAALVELCKGAEDDSIGVRLLTDIAKIFLDADAKLDTVKLPSEDIVGELHKVEVSPWSEWGKLAKPISKKGLACLLKKFEIKPRLLSQDDKNNRARGYYRRDFVDAWTRYCANIPSELIERAQKDSDPEPKPTPEETAQNDLFPAAAVTVNGSEKHRSPIRSRFRPMFMRLVTLAQIKRGVRA